MNINNVLLSHRNRKWSFLTNFEVSDKNHRILIKSGGKDVFI